MKVDVKTIDEREMTYESATQQVGSALRIAPAFIARRDDDAIGVRTELRCEYIAWEGRYVIRRVTNEALQESAELNHSLVAKVRMQAIVQAAAPHCIFLTLDEESDPDARWISADALSSAEGRLLPPALAQAVVRRGGTEARMEAIEMLYGTAALSSQPPAKLIQKELGIPHRTASQWIIDARKAGRLEGMNYNAARPAGA
ncbi:hypothetical protein [Microbacterium deminutum]|uniref:hypothetical protein n=1 Tax=Microbacterium deminutum TaxID=344164 RepID=UPI0031CF32D9